MVGKIFDNEYYVGSRRLIAADPPEELVEKLENEGKTVVYVGDKNRILGLIAVQDKLRESSYYAINELKKRGIKTVMITGDNKRTASAIARKLGIDEYYAELLPEDKVRVIERASKTYGHVAMVGDGVNDAPALAKANVGIAMGAIGSDVALETADVALMQDDLTRIPYLTRLSKKTLEVVKENIFASILIKGSFALLALFGFISLWLAVAIGDMGLSLAVIANAMRLSLVK